MPKATISTVKPEYELHLTARGLAPNTVKMNMQALNRWLDLVGDTRIDQITGSHIDRLFGSAGWSPKTQNLYLSILRGNFFAWCRRHGYMKRDFDPTDGWRNVRTESREQFWLPVEEFPALLDAAGGPRDRAIIALGLYTFLRGSEIASLRLQDIDLDRYTLTAYRWKTKQADTMPIPLELADELRSWLREYKRLMRFALLPEWFLVPAKTALPMAWDHDAGMLQPTGEEARLKPETPMGKPYECVKRALRSLGYDPLGTGAHTLRRSGARALFDRLRSEGYDGALRRVSSMLGHKDTKTTEIYLGLSLERQQRNELLAGKMMFPAARTADVVRLEARGGDRG